MNLKKLIDQKFNNYINIEQIHIFQLNGKIADDDKKKVLDKCQESLSWLDANQTADKEEIEQQQKELESVFNPVIVKLYLSANFP